MEPQVKSCANCKANFDIEPADFDFYEKMQAPAPTFCPNCRMIRRMSFWNERNFFKKLEKRTGKEIFSMYPPDAPIEIYDRDYWWSDAWDPKSYGRDIDWNRSFWDQIRELQLAVPFSAKAVHRMVNSDYSNNAADLKNCYLCFNADVCEDSMYGVGMQKVKNCIDVYQSAVSEYCYELQTCARSYQCFFMSESADCRNVWLSYNCENCSDCFGCVNLRSKKYCIFNKEYYKEDYFKELEKLGVGSYSAMEKLKRKFEEFRLKFPNKYYHGVMNKDSSGDYLYYNKNVTYSYMTAESENSKYTQFAALGVKDTYDYTNWGNNTEQMYECVASGEFNQNLKFCWECWPSCRNLEYSMLCHSTADSFACVGLDNGKHCILNKEYSKEEYEELLPKVKKLMDDIPYVDKRGIVYKYGEFFPSEFSLIAANDSAIPDYVENFDEKKAETYGLKWRAVDPAEYEVTMQASDLPDLCADTTDEITKEVIACLRCKRGYRILPAEKDFYKRFSIPFPRKCHTCRHIERIENRNKPTWYERSCQCAGTADESGVYKNDRAHEHGLEQCKNSFITGFSPKKPDIVYCEECYKLEVLS